MSVIKNRKGFTLIELIVILAIIAILAAVLVPRFTGFTESAKEKTAISEARNVLIAIEALNADGKVIHKPSTSEEEAIIQAYIDEYLGKELNGNIVWSSDDLVTFCYNVAIDTKTYSVGVNAGIIDTTFNFHDPNNQGDLQSNSYLNN